MATPAVVLERLLYLQVWSFGKNVLKNGLPGLEDWFLEKR